MPCRERDSEIDRYDCLRGRRRSADALIRQYEVPAAQSRNDQCLRRASNRAARCRHLRRAETAEPPALGEEDLRAEGCAVLEWQGLQGPLGTARRTRSVMLRTLRPRIPVEAPTLYFVPVPGRLLSCQRTVASNAIQ